MATAPGKVIRSLRQALDMSQAEFARAAGYSASTISSWERGSTRPSRLAFKTILAFAEERGVRYRPTGASPGAPTAASPALPAPTSALPTIRLGSHLPPMPTPVVAREPVREESFGSRRWTDVAASGVVVDVSPSAAVGVRTATFDARLAAVESARPEWAFDAHLRLELGRGTAWSKRASVLAAVLVAVAIGAGAGTMLRGRAAPRSIEGEHATVASSAPAAPRVPIHADDLALAADATTTLGVAPYAAGVVAPSVAAVAPMPPTSRARLESIVALDGTRRATFRVGDRSITLVEGDDLGGRTLTLIGNDEVALVGGGVATRVRLGFDAPLD